MATSDEAGWRGGVSMSRDTQWKVRRTFSCQKNKFIYSLTTLIFRYVSISTSSAETTFYLCEVQVLSPASEQMIPSQCSLQQTSQKSLKSYSIYKNSCFHLQSESKLNFNQSVDFCKEKGFEVIHNKTNDGGLSYLFARSDSCF